jgi:hypothetical protein
MITGFNTDVDYQDRVFHVQTEDKGLDNPVVESLVYCGGEIIESQRNSYADLSEGGSYSEDEILMRMEAQHQAMIREIRNGRYDTEGPKPFGHNIISNHSLDEVVLDFLHGEEELGSLRLNPVEDAVLQHGSRPTLRMSVLEEQTGRPIAGAQVRFTLISTQDRPRELFSGTSADDGVIEATVEIPSMPEADLAILCRASAAGRRTELRQLVHCSAERSNGPVEEKARKKKGRKAKG